MVYTSVYSAPPPSKKGTSWGALLMTAPAAAAYVGVSEAELAALHARGVLPGVLLGDGAGVRFRRGDLAQLPARLVARSGRSGRVRRRG